MDSRAPKSRLSGNRLSPAGSAKGLAGPATAQSIKQRLAEDPLWGYFALNGKWVCPFCLASVNRRSGRSREDSIAVHLETCRGFANGHGQSQAVEVIARRQQYENLVHLADSDPSWRVYDQTGTWYCPACLDRIPSVRIQGGQLTSFIYQAMAEHVSRCGSYLRGARPQPEEVQRARDRAARFPALIQSLQQNIQFAIWRYVDGMGLWVCPCCLKHISRVRIAKESDWQRAPEPMAHHLLQECPAYANNPTVIESEVAVRDAAAAAAPVFQPVGIYQTPNSSTPTTAPLPYRTPSVGNIAPPIAYRTPVVGTAMPIAQPVTPNGTQRLTGSPSAGVPSHATPPVARPISTTARYPLTPPGSTQLSTDGTPMGMRRTDTTPSGGPRVGVPLAAQGSPVAKWLPPKNATPAEPLPLPASQTPPVPPSNTKEQTLFGKLPEDFLSQTAFGDFDDQFTELAHTNDPAEADAETTAEPALAAETHPHDQVPTSEHDADGRHSFNWMDDAENLAPPEDPMTPAERTDMAKAVAVQQGLMQKPPEIPGYAFGATFEACTDISGDFYQFIRLPDGRVGFALGDVSGHGVQAGLIMSMAKKTFEIYASMGLSPADTLSRVNDAIARDLGGKLFISMVYALLDPTERTITWARAGHNPSIRYNPDDGVIEEIKPPGMVVGMKSGAMFRNSLQEQVTQIRSGDIILLYTDGITETMNLQQEEFDTDRLFDVIKKFGSEGPEILVSRIMEIIRHFRGPQPPSDDATLLALRVE
jgi:Stage II sporulation protein E (SpoIIE)